jgi:hypothetical protein
MGSIIVFIGCKLFLMAELAYRHAGARLPEGRESGIRINWPVGLG